MKTISILNQSLAEIEKARAKFVETVNAAQLDVDSLGKLAAIDESLAKAEKDFHEFITDLAIATHSSK